MKVSVIIPMYNSSETIINTLNSVKVQSYKDIEVIIVDDGSNDSSVSLVENYMFLNSELSIKLIKKDNQGVSAARNIGMKASNGELIALLDSDDEWLPNKLEVQMDILKDNPDIDFLGTNRNAEHFENFFFKKFSKLTRITSRLLLYKTFFVTPTVLFKRKILETVGFFDEQQKYAEEGNFWIRVCRENNCVLLNESLVITGGGKPHFGFSGLSSNLLEMEKGELKNLKDAYELKIIGFLEYIFLICYSILKYIRRTIIVRIRK